MFKIKIQSNSIVENNKDFLHLYWFYYLLLNFFSDILSDKESAIVAPVPSPDRTPLF